MRITTEDVGNFELEEMTPDFFAKFIYASTKYTGQDPIVLYPYQIKLAWAIISSVIDKGKKEILGFQARQSGKTETVADVVYTLMCLPSMGERFRKMPYRIGIFGPKKEQADILYQRLKERFDSSFAKEFFGVEIMERNKTMIRLNNGSYVKSITASMTATIEGETFDLIIIEEAQDVADVRIKKSIFPMLSRTSGTRVLIGTSTPEKSGGYFLDSVRLNPERVIKIDCYEAAKYSEPYAKYLEDMESTLGVESAEFKTQYLLQPVEYASSFISEEELKGVKGKEKELTTKFNGPTVAGLDLAKSPDSTVLTILDATRPRILYWLEIQHDNYDEQLSTILRKLDDFPGLIRIVVDGLGQGAVMGDFISRHFSGLQEREVDVVISMSHVKKKSMMYSSLREAFRRKLFTYPDINTKERLKFEKECLGLSRTFSERFNCYKYAHPPRGHDDYVDSLALAWMGMMEDSPFVMRVRSETELGSETAPFETEGNMLESSVSPLVVKTNRNKYKSNYNSRWKSRRSRYNVR